METFACFVAGIVIACSLALAFASADAYYAEMAYIQIERGW